MLKVNPVIFSSLVFPFPFCSFEWVRVILGYELLKWFHASYIALFFAPIIGVFRACKFLISRVCCLVNKWACCLDGFYERIFHSSGFPLLISVQSLFICSILLAQLYQVSLFPVYLSSCVVFK